MVVLPSIPEFPASLRPFYAMCCLMAGIYASLVQLRLQNNYLKRLFSVQKNTILWSKSVTMILESKIKNLIKNQARLGKVTQKRWNDVSKSIWIRKSVSKKQSKNKTKNKKNIMLLVTHIYFFHSKKCFLKVLNIHLDSKCFFLFESLSTTEHRQNSLNWNFQNFSNDKFPLSSHSSINSLSSLISSTYA